MKRLVFGWLFVTAALIVLAMPRKTEAPIQLHDEPPAAVEQKPAPREFLRIQSEQVGLAEWEIETMAAIVQCESGWEQAWPDGKVKVSNGNIGLAQINYLAHHEEYERLDLDPYDPNENLTYALILYKRNGVRDWEQWSGHCWKPILAKKGIFFHLEDREGEDGGQCVAFIENLFGNWEAMNGSASEIVPNSDSPGVGKVVIMGDSEKGHVALIYRMEGDEMILAESNYRWDEKITVGRRLSVKSPKIRGYFSF